MKRLFIVLICIVTLFTGCDNKPQPISLESNLVIENPDFRNTKWGMSLNEVKNIETATYIDGNPTTLMFTDTLLSFPLSILYKFNEKGLHTGFYDFKPSHTNLNLFYEDYKTAIREYIKKYGEPANSEEIWLNNLLKEDSDKVGLALASGHVKFITDWKTDTTKITLMISGNNSEISFVCIYESLINKNNQNESIVNGI